MLENSKRISLFKPFFNIEEKNNVVKVIKSGWVTSGPVTQQFEKEVAKFIDAKHTIAVNSCTNGIIAVLQSLNLKPGDEVLTSPMTFVSVIHALEMFKLKIKLVDVNLENYSLNYSTIQKNITKKTKLIIITHYGGIPIDNKKIIKLCKKKKIFLIEDAATSFGSSINRKMTGSSNYAITIFSFYANKVITTGEGGIIALQNKILAKKIRSIISCGVDRDPWKRTFQKKLWFYNVINFGYKFNFTDLQAAIGLAQLKKIKKIILYRKKIKSLYNKYLYKLIKKKILFLPIVSKNVVSSEYIYTILIKANNKNLRDKLINFLDKNSVSTTVHYIPANKHKIYIKKYKNTELQNSNYIFNNILSLPFHNNLKKNEIIKISNLIKKFFYNYENH